MKDLTWLSTPDTRHKPWGRGRGGGVLLCAMRLTEPSSIAKCRNNVRGVLFDWVFVGQEGSKAGVFG